MESYPDYISALLGRDDEPVIEGSPSKLIAFIAKWPNGDYSMSFCQNTKYSLFDSLDMWANPFRVCDIWVCDRSSVSSGELDTGNDNLRIDLSWLRAADVEVSEV